MTLFDPAASDYRPFAGEDKLRAAVKAAGLALRINTQARRERRPAIQIFAKGNSARPLIVASSAQSAIDWLEERKQWEHINA